MMDILYVIGKGSKWNDNELRYSLRSIEKNCKNVGRIFIAGYCPRFIDKTKVVYVPVDDKYDCKHKNIMNCIETAVMTTDISDDFLYSSDDHFYVQRTDFDNYPFYRKPVELPKLYEAKPYRRTLTSTRKVLEKHGLTIHNFSWHGNTHFNKTLFLEPEFEAMRKESYDVPFGCEPSILMLNYWLSRRPFEITDRADNKFSKLVTEVQVMGTAKERECISCSSDMADVVKRFITKLFPNKSKYEL